MVPSTKFHEDRMNDAKVIFSVRSIIFTHNEIQFHLRAYLYYFLDISAFEVENLSCLTYSRSNKTRF